MRNALNKIFALGLCAFALTTAASAADKQKIHLSDELDWLELRTIFASSDGPSLSDIEAGLRATQALGVKDKPTIRRESATRTLPLQLSKASLTADKAISDAKSIETSPGRLRVTGPANGSVSGR